MHCLRAKGQLWVFSQKPIISALLKKYEHIFLTGNEGMHFENVYGEDGEPRDFWLKMYEEVWQDLEEMGLKR